MLKNVKEVKMCLTTKTNLFRSPNCASVLESVHAQPEARAFLKYPTQTPQLSLFGIGKITFLV